MFIERLTDILWPYLEDETASDRTQRQYANQAEVNDIANIVVLDVETGILIEEGRRLEGREHERVNSAETKAAVFLAAGVALVPVMGLFLSEVSPSNERNWVQIVKAFFLLVEVVYLFGLIWHAVKALSVQAYQRVSVPDILSTLKSPEPFPLVLAKDLLSSVRRNQDTVNLKVSYMMCAKDFFVRMIVVLSACFVFGVVLRFETFLN